MSTTARRAGIVAALVSSAALIAPAFAGALPTGSLGSDETAPGFTCDATSTETTANGWGIPFDDEKDQTASYTVENVLDVDGSLKLEVDGVEDRSVSYHSAGAVKLSDILDKEIGFAERAETAKASFQLRLSGTTGGKFTDTGFTTLVWVPGVTAPDTTDGALHANLQDGEWWSTQNIDGAKDFARVSLDAIAEAQPNAVVDHYGISIGRGSAATSTLVDAVTFNGCTTNFAKKDAEPETGTGSLGNLGNIFGS
ncbi:MULTISPECIES: hypothetical protein [Rhodococcus]|uniref:hypothetical protein n=1 Tax=Rhodococcus TaxID=1827 RepID=UPI00071D4DA0|nr:MULTISPECIES: hypothetical protein [Rhodococcus]ANQ75784.1 hypothetical protein AOT96_32915 [Rhodococcus sp. 008]KSU64847.1 hypothetical protein AS032_33210 [Rhodococcus qingshengii]SCC70225.1 hypothetical protein GA0061093_13514 [Rhodococcus qingshengii]